MHEADAVPPLEFQDRRTGLIVFGILLILWGCGVALLIPFMLLGTLFSGTLPGTEPVPIRVVLPGLFFYLFLAVAFIWLGIGSLKCRRWARALILVIAWGWLVAGTEALIAMFFIMPRVLAHPRPGVPQLPPELQIVVTLIGLGIDAVFVVFIPCVLVLFFRSRHVKATCEARDPATRWTDACPLPVLGLSVLIAFSAAAMLVMVLFSTPVVPCFGYWLSGLPACAVLLLAVIVHVFCARACYKLQSIGWWVTLVSAGLWLLSSTITMALVGVLPMYELMGLPPAHLAQIKQTGILEGPTMLIMSCVCSIPYWGFIIFTKRFFKKTDGGISGLPAGVSTRD